MERPWPLHFLVLNLQLSVWAEVHAVGGGTKLLLAAVCMTWQCVKYFLADGICAFRVLATPLERDDAHAHEVISSNVVSTIDAPISLSPAKKYSDLSEF